MGVMPAQTLIGLHCPDHRLLPVSRPPPPPLSPVTPPPPHPLPHPPPGCAVCQAAGPVPPRLQKVHAGRRQGACNGRTHQEWRHRQGHILRWCVTRARGVCHGCQLPAKPGLALQPRPAGYNAGILHKGPCMGRAGAVLRRLRRDGGGRVWRI